MTLKRGKRVRLLIAIALILTSVGGVIGGIWLSIQLFINPDAASVKQLLPWAQSPVNPEYVQLPQIKTSIQQLGQIPGEPLPLEVDNSLQRSLLLPVLNQRPNCQNNCEQIVELRLYQQVIVSNLKETYYQLVDQIPITGLDRASVLSWLVEAGVANSDSDDSALPLTELHRFIGNTPKQGIWLYLLGRMHTSAIAYGYILHYNPKTSELNLLLPWITTGVVPEWQQITGSASPELVVNRTVDLEPQLSVYQVKPSELNTIELSEISLIKPALKNPAYQDALFLAQNGLWSPAWKWLQFIKQHNQDWSTASQAQMDLIRLYAVFTQAQADKIWASPSQQVLANLIDGRWASALQVFQAAVENTQDTEEIIALLTDDEQLWNRVEAALQVNPNRPEVQAWKELILAARSGEGLGARKGWGEGVTRFRGEKEDLVRG